MLGWGRLRAESLGAQPLWTPRLGTRFLLVGGDDAEEAVLADADGGARAHRGLGGRGPDTIHLDSALGEEVPAHIAQRITEEAQK